MLPDAECLRVIYEIMRELDLGDFEIKVTHRLRLRFLSRVTACKCSRHSCRAVLLAAQVNHRRLLDAYLGACGVPLSAVRTVCSSIDKLDKTPWAEVRDELLSEKHLAPEVVDRIAHYVKLASERPICNAIDYCVVIKNKVLEIPTYAVCRVYTYMPIIS